MKRLLFISFLTFASCGEIPTFDLDAGDSPDCPPCSYNRTSCQAVQVEDCIDNCIDAFLSFQSEPALENVLKIV